MMERIAEGADLPVVPVEDEPAPFTLRQSTLATFSRCPLSARFEMEVGERHAPPLARGSLFHEVMERCLRDLHRHGGEQIPQDVALEHMYAVLADEEKREGGPLVIPPDERVALRQIVVRWATDRKWNTRQIMGLEKQLRTEIVGPDGVARVLTGTPDVLIASPPDEVVVYDAKTSFGPPKSPRGDQQAAEQGEHARRYLTERGHYQLDAYGLLVMDEYPAVQKATLLEDHPRVGEERRATLHRDELEHVRRLIGIDLMLADQGTREGPDSSVWKAVPGKQCAWCLKPRACPRDAATRGEGAIDGPEVAREFALDLQVLAARKDHVREAAVAWVDAHGPIDVGGGLVLGWDMPPPADAANAPDAPRGTCKWCGHPIVKADGSPDRRRNYHGGAERGEPACKDAWDAAGGSAQFRVHDPIEFGVAPDFEPPPPPPEPVPEREWAAEFGAQAEANREARG